MGIVEEIKVKNLPNAELSVNEGKVVTSEITKDLRISFSPYYKVQLEKIEKELGLSTRATFIFLIDYYNIDSSDELKRIRKRLLHRIRKGVNVRFLIELRILYTALGHFLRKIRYIK